MSKNFLGFQWVHYPLDGLLIPKFWVYVVGGLVVVALGYMTFG